MSVVVSCNLSDGVIIGTDSAITIRGQAPGPDGKVQTGVIKVYNYTEKLFQLKDFPIAIATCGLGILGERSIGSYVKEFEFSLKGAKEKKVESMTVGEVSEELRSFFLTKYEQELGPALEKELGVTFKDLGDEKKPLLEFVVAGFSPKEYLSEVWHLRVPFRDKKRGLINVREKGKFGTNWFGHTDPIHRLIKGFDRAVPPTIAEYLARKHSFKITEAEKKEIMQQLVKFEHRIPYAAMPIQEGVNHVKSLLDLVISQTKYVIGAEICGGPIKIGVVQRGEKEFKIITDNEISLTA